MKAGKPEKAVPPATRILIADDHGVMTHGLRQLLKTRPGWEVCAAARTGREAVQLALDLCPHVAVLDILMPELNGLEAARQILKALPRTAILFYTMCDAELAVRDAFAAGGRGFLLKSDPLPLLVTAIETLLQGKLFFSPKVSATVVGGFLNIVRPDGPLDPTATSLTTREREIIQLLAEGRMNKEVAASLGVSIKTVETHRASLMKKLGLSGTADLVRFAVRNNIIQA